MGLATVRDRNTLAVAREKSYHVGQLMMMKWILLVFFAVLGWFHYRGMFASVVGHIGNSLEYMGHVFAVPIFSLWSVVWRRGEFRKAAGAWSYRGCGWVCLFLMVAWVADGCGYERVNQISLIGLLWSVPYALWGREVGRLMLFPAWVFLFTVPLTLVLDGFIGFLRTFAAATAVGILNGFGMEIMREGTLVGALTPGKEFRLNIADECSGIRSLFAIMMMTSTYAHFVLKSKLKRWLLFALSIPIAVLGNMIRILLVCLVAYYTGEEAAAGFFHTYSGYVVYFIAVSVMLVVAERIEKSGSSALRPRILRKWFC